MEEQTLSLKTTTSTSYIKIKSHPRLKPTTPAKPDPTATDPYYYGYRDVIYTTPDGKEDYHQIPLTQEDFLNPQIGDRFVQGDKHFIINAMIVTLLKSRYKNDPHTAVFGDMKMFWDIPNLKEPAPDVAVVPNVKNKNTDRVSFNIKEEGTKPCLVIEIISPRYKGDDTVKVEIYEQVGIEEYIIIDPVEGEPSEFKVWGYRLVQGHYQRIVPNAEGRILSQTTNLYFAIEKDNKGEAQLRLLDAETKQPLLDYNEIELAYLAAEAKAKREAESRLAAEAKAKKETESRLAAEAKAKEVEDRLTALQAQIKQLQLNQTE